jgi:hypothetical protein
MVSAPASVQVGSRFGIRIRGTGGAIVDVLVGTTPVGSVQLDRSGNGIVTTALWSVGSVLITARETVWTAGVPYFRVGATTVDVTSGPPGTSTTTVAPPTTTVAPPTTTMAPTTTTTVPPDVHIIVVSASTLTPRIGQLVTLTAQVPAGFWWLSTVDFSLDGIPIGTAVIDTTTGRGSITTSFWQTNLTIKATNTLYGYAGQIVLVGQPR